MDTGAFLCANMVLTLQSSLQGYGNIIPGVCGIGVSWLDIEIGLEFDDKDSVEDLKKQLRFNDSSYLADIAKYVAGQIVVNRPSIPLNGATTGNIVTVMQPRPILKRGPPGTHAPTRPHKRAKWTHVDARRTAVRHRPKQPSRLPPKVYKDKHARLMRIPSRLPIKRHHYISNRPSHLTSS